SSSTSTRTWGWPSPTTPAAATTAGRWATACAWRGSAAGIEGPGSGRAVAPALTLRRPARAAAALAACLGLAACAVLDGPDGLHPDPTPVLAQRAPAGPLE